MTEVMRAFLCFESSRQPATGQLGQLSTGRRGGTGDAERASRRGAPNHKGPPHNFLQLFPFSSPVIFCWFLR